MFGFSRDDCQSFLPEYLQLHLLAADPFASLDVRGVGSVMRTAVQVRTIASPTVYGYHPLNTTRSSCCILPLGAAAAFALIALIFLLQPFLYPCACTTENPSLQPRLQGGRVRRARRRPQVHQVSDPQVGDACWSSAHATPTVAYQS